MCYRGCPTFYGVRSGVIVTSETRKKKKRKKMAQDTPSGHGSNAEEKLVAWTSIRLCASRHDDQAGQSRKVPTQWNNREFADQIGQQCSRQQRRSSDESLLPDDQTTGDGTAVPRQGPRKRHASTCIETDHKGDIQVSDCRLLGSEVLKIKWEDHNMCRYIC